jgi:hypothetical protein
MHTFFSPTKPHHLLHLHGNYSRLRAVVLPSKDNHRSAGQPCDGVAIDPLQRLLQKHMVLFIGRDGPAMDLHVSYVLNTLQRETAATEHVMLYRRAPGDTSPAPDYATIWADPHGDFGDLPATIRKVLPDVFH